MFLQVLEMMGRVFVQTFTSPLFAGIYLGLVLLVAWQYQRLYQMSENVVNVKMPSCLRPALVSTLLGLAGSLAGSVLLVFMGIDLGNIAIVQLWLVALLLMFISPRFLCFAYAGGVLALANLIIGYPQMSVSGLMGLVAVLHMVESLLILLNGHLHPVPVYVQANQGLRGGFNLQKFWPLPLVALASAGFIGGSSGIAMPDWWPLLKDAAYTNDTSYVLVPVLAVLGYGEINTTRSPEQAARRSSFHLFIFSLLLLALSILASRFPALLYACAVFSPVGHELVIWLGMREEKNRPPIYLKPPAGIMVLAVVPGSPAARAGLSSRDIITRVNDEEQDDYLSLKTKLLLATGYSHKLTIVRDGKTLNLTYTSRPDEEAGIIPAPEAGTRRFLVINDDRLFNLFRNLWSHLKK